MIMLNGQVFDEHFFIASFISGLTEELQSFVSLFDPKTVTQAIELV